MFCLKKVFFGGVGVFEEPFGGLCGVQNVHGDFVSLCS